MDTFILRFRKVTPVCLMVCALAWFALSPPLKAQCPSSCNGSSTALGNNALNPASTGINNTAVGTNALADNTSGQFNVAVGAGALANNTVGSQALLNNMNNGNTAVGFKALAMNTTADTNTALGASALASNQAGDSNTALGADALSSNTTINGDSGGGNTAVGTHALNLNTIGGGNIALGFNAGSALTTGNFNIDIGNVGVADESATIRIGDESIHGATFVAGISGQGALAGDAVFVTSTGKLGTVNVSSSARFKDEIKPIIRLAKQFLRLSRLPFAIRRRLTPKPSPSLGWWRRMLKRSILI